uniref:Uncharacterized protein n=1 Tax=Anguilla anguilla TaxID=7936 RepID=A0A0E9U878_ANGAN
MHKPFFYIFCSTCTVPDKLQSLSQISSV